MVKDLKIGGDTLADFALALLIGLVIGTYSSVFTATPIAIFLEERYPAPEPEPQKAEHPLSKKNKAAPKRIFD